MSRCLALLVVTAAASSLAIAQAPAPPSGTSQTYGVPKGGARALDQIYDTKIDPTSGLRIRTYRASPPVSLPASFESAASRLAGMKVTDPTEHALRESLLSVLKRIKECPSCAEVLNPPPPGVGTAPMISSPPVTGLSVGSKSGGSSFIPTCPGDSRFYYLDGRSCVTAKQAVQIETLWSVKK